MRLLIQRFNHYIGRERGFVIIDRAYQELILNPVKKKRSAFQISKKSKNESNKVQFMVSMYTVLWISYKSFFGFVSELYSKNKV